MAINDILYQTEGVIFTSTPLTLGYGIEQTVPARYVICSPINQDIAVVLPQIEPDPNLGEYTPGSGPGFAITIINLSATHNVIIEAAGTDTLVGVPNLTSQYSSVNVFSSPAGSWYVAGSTASAGNPAGSSNQVQYNSGGFFAANSAFLFIPGIGIVTSLPFFISANAAPTDGSLANGEAAMWFDPTNGAASLNFKAKQLDGTIVTATVLLS